MEGHRLGQDLRPDQLVERIVAADVLADRDQLAAGREEPRRVEPAGLVEGSLGGAEEIRQREDDAAFNDRTGRERGAANLDLVERRLAADPARRRRGEVSLRDDGCVEGASARRTVTRSSGWFISAGSPRSIRGPPGPR